MCHQEQTSHSLFGSIFWVRRWWGNRLRQKVKDRTGQRSSSTLMCHSHPWGTDRSLMRSAVLSASAGRARTRKKAWTGRNAGLHYWHNVLQDDTLLPLETSPSERMAEERERRWTWQHGERGGFVFLAPIPITSTWWWPRGPCHSRSLAVPALEGRKCSLPTPPSPQRQTHCHLPCSVTTCERSQVTVKSHLTYTDFFF